MPTGLPLTALVRQGPPRPQVRLEPIPDLPAPPSVAPDAAQIDRIKELIRRLQTVSQLCIGSGPSMSVSAFVPLATLTGASTVVLTRHTLRSADVFTELVRLGPRALPFLLERLEDATPTRLTLTPVEMGGMEFSRELAGNPANRREQGILARLPPLKESTGAVAAVPYTATVGDLCFVAIGQIVSREYDAARYQPTASMVIKSPSRDPELARTVRALWSSSDPARHLWESLLLDYCTRGVPPTTEDEGFDEWAVGSSPQIPAATRLLFYFPRQSAPLIARRLDQLQLREPDIGRRELTNGVRTNDFLRAVAWCREPLIQAALLSVARRTADTGPMLAVLPGLNTSHWPLVRRRIQAELDQLPYETEGWYESGYALLKAARSFAGEKARPLYRRYLRRASAQRCLSVCEALSETKGEWDQEFLWPMLTDKRPSKGYSHPVSKVTDSARLPIRVCDQAAETICRHRKDVRFEIVGSVRQLDVQIARLRQHLARSKSR